MRFVLVAVVLTVLSSSLLHPLAADPGRILTPRRILGVAFLGGSAALTQKGFDLRDEADDFYSAYEEATDPPEIERLYQRTMNRDVKSQVSWALAVACGVTGVRLLLTGTPQRPDVVTAAAALSPSRTSLPAGRLRLLPAFEPGRVSLRLERPFF